MKLFRVLEEAAASWGANALWRQFVRHNSEEEFRAARNFAKIKTNLIRRPIIMILFHLLSMLQSNKH